MTHLILYGSNIISINKPKIDFIKSWIIFIKPIINTILIY